MAQVEVNPRDYRFIRFDVPNATNTRVTTLTAGQLYGRLWSDPDQVLRALQGWRAWEEGRRLRAAGEGAPWGQYKERRGWREAEEMAESEDEEEEERDRRRSVEASLIRRKKKKEEFADLPDWLVAEWKSGAQLRRVATITEASGRTVPWPWSVAMLGPDPLPPSPEAPVLSLPGMGFVSLRWLLQKWAQSVCRSHRGRWATDGTTWAWEGPPLPTHELASTAAQRNLWGVRGRYAGAAQWRLVFRRWSELGWGGSEGKNGSFAVQWEAVVPGQLDPEALNRGAYGGATAGASTSGAPRRAGHAGVPPPIRAQPPPPTTAAERLREALTEINATIGPTPPPVCNPPPSSPPPPPPLLPPPPTFPSLQILFLVLLLVSLLPT